MSFSGEGIEGWGPVGEGGRKDERMRWLYLWGSLKGGEERALRPCYLPLDDLHHADEGCTSHTNSCQGRSKLTKTEGADQEREESSNDSSARDTISTSF